MNRWNSFLSSLGTRGGAIFLLSVIFATGVAVSIHLIHHNEAGTPLAATIMGMFSSFSGALLLALKGSSESTATATGPGGTATASTAPSAVEIATPKTEPDEPKSNVTTNIK